VVCPFFGYFPWECFICRNRFLLRHRTEPQGQAKKKAV